jgi:hypothetical protein
VQTKRQKESELASDLQRSLMRAGGWAGGISSRGSGEREKKGAARKADPTRGGERDDPSFFYASSSSSSFYPSSFVLFLS